MYLEEFDWSLNNHQYPETSSMMPSSMATDTQMKPYVSHHQIANKSDYKYYSDGGFSEQFTNKSKTTRFGHCHDGNHRYRIKEVDSNTFMTFHEKRNGIITDAETHVNYQKTTTYPNAPTSSRPYRRPGGAQFKKVVGAEVSSGSGGAKCEFVSTYNNDTGGYGRGRGRGRGSTSNGFNHKVNFSTY